LVANSAGESIQLPTELELVTELKVSRQTVRRAYQELEVNGLIERIPGRGTFSIPKGSHPVNQTLGSVEDLMELSVDTKLELISRMELIEAPEIAQKLKLDEPLVGHAKLVRLYRSEVFCVSDIYAPPQIAETIIAENLLPDEGSITFVEILEGLIANGVCGAVQELRAMASEEDLSKRLGIEAGTPILRAERLYYDMAGKFVGLATTFYSPHLYTYKVDLRRRGTHR
jgi:GntR family transcriptional regulator